MKKFLPLLVLTLLVVGGIAFGLSQTELLQGKYTGTTYERMNEDGSGGKTEGEDLTRDSDDSGTTTTEIRERSEGSTDTSTSSDATYQLGLIGNMLNDDNIDFEDLVADDGATAEELGLDPYCSDELGSYSGGNEYVETALMAAYEACYNMQAAEESKDGAYSAYLAATNAELSSDAASAEVAYQTAQEHADDAAGYADNAQDAADEAQDAADSTMAIEIEVVDTGGIQGVDPDALDGIDETPAKDIEAEHIKIYPQEFNWYQDPGQWIPDVTTVNIYTSAAEEFYQGMLNSADLTEFNQGGEYYEFMVALYADSMATNSEYAEGAITESYTNGMLGVSQISTYNMNNSVMNSTLNNLFR